MEKLDRECQREAQGRKGFKEEDGKGMSGICQKGSRNRAVEKHTKLERFLLVSPEEKEMEEDSFLKPQNPSEDQDSSLFGPEEEEAECLKKVFVKLSIALLKISQETRKIEKRLEKNKLQMENIIAAFEQKQKALD